MSMATACITPVRLASQNMTSARGNTSAAGSGRWRVSARRGQARSSAQCSTYSSAPMKATQ
jgi:hypothetical protein